MDKKSISKRLQEFREAQKIKSVRAFALEVNADPSYFDKVLKGTADITERILNGLQNRYKLNPRWVEFGEIPQFLEKENGDGNNYNGDIIDAKNETISILKDQVATLKDKVAILMDENKRLSKQCEVSLTGLNRYAQVVSARVHTILEHQGILRALAYQSKTDQKKIDAAQEEVRKLYSEILRETVEVDAGRK